MGFELGGKVQGVTPARRNFYERNLFYVGFSSTATASTGTIWQQPANLMMMASCTSDYHTIRNYSTRLDWLHVYFTATAVSSKFSAVYCNVDTTTLTHTAQISTANLTNNYSYNWVIPLPPRTEVYFLASTGSSGGYYMLQTAESFGDHPAGNP